MQIGIVRGDDGDFPVSVDYTTADGPAKAGEDYTATEGKFEFAAGEQVKLFMIPILKDGLRETNETFRLNLANPTGTILGNSKSATITVVDAELKR